MAGGAADAGRASWRWTRTAAAATADAGGASWRWTVGTAESLWAAAR